jgi:hypothetical protein
MVSVEKVADGSPVARRRSRLGMEKAQWTEISEGLEETIGTSQPDFIHTKYTVQPPKTVLHGFVGIAKKLHIILLL